MKLLIMILLLSAPVFAQTDPSTVGHLPNKIAIQQEMYENEYYKAN